MTGNREQGTGNSLVTMEPARAPRVFFANLEEALAIDDRKSKRREARAFMCIRDQVLVFPVEKEEFSDSGLLVLPATGQERQSEGIVIAAGRGRMDANNVFVPTEVEPGDRVLFGKYAGTEVVLRGKTCRLMREEELLGVIR
ncbi:MAG: co-chaperone GroES [Terracidiphilus sp.]